MAYDNSVITDIMKDIGCGDGFHIPVANEENQLLENEIKELLKKKAELLVIDESMDNELRDSKNILTNLSNHENQNQKLIIANRQQHETEQHLLIAAQRDSDCLSKEYRTLKNNFNELTENQNKMENELAKTDEKIKELKETIEWGDETLLAWNNDLVKRCTDVNILETYHLEDNNRFKELELRRQYLQRDVIDRESLVEKEVGELLQVERELEQTARLTRQAQHERNHRLEQWENAVNFLNSNQKDSQNTIEEINKIRLAAREVYDNMNENKQKYQEYLEKNEELENKMEEVNKVNNELKLSTLNKLSETEDLQSEVLSAQKALSVMGNKLENERTKRKHMENELTKLKTQIQQKEKSLAKIKDDLSKIKNQSMTTEERLNELNLIYNQKKSEAEKFMSEKNKLLNIAYNVRNEISQEKINIDLLTSQLERICNKQNLLSKEESKLKKLILEKKEIVYNLSFQLETIRIGIAEAKGTTDIEEMKVMQEKLQKCNEELRQAIDHQHQLEKQLKSTESETRRITKQIEKNTTELEILRNRVEELNVTNEGGVKQIQVLKETNHRYHMEEMMVKLKIEQMKKLTNNECDKVYSLAQQREELTMGINNRKKEVAEIYKRISDEKKLLLDEKSTIKRKLDSMVQYIEQRKTKHQILLSTMGGPSARTTVDGSGDDDCDGVDEDISSFRMSEHRIRVAQEKLELQETGDRLDERVQKLETEIRAMENTLHVLNANNHCYKSGMSSVNPESEEYKEKVVLEETYEKLNSMWLQKKKTLENLENEIRDLEVQYKVKSEELESLINIRDIKDGERERVLKESNEQIMKLNRANNRIEFDMKTIDKCCDPDKRNALELIKRDIVVRMMKKVNKCVLEQLSEMSVRHIEVEPTVKQYLSEKDLELPVVSGLFLNKAKSSCGSSSVSLMSSNSSVKSYSDEDKQCSYSVVNLGPTALSGSVKSGTSIVTKRYK
ncbi:coiled-coil domain-containing protein 39-like isoform X1 [Myzus persicae]|uniref:coiled-coil domain-containing protein 39-like isoform X1 n=2 Tax=Myzus persicae TaxID=13164 RepID=UPI000B930C46|nr:coiled-coil domain-containing protein 39-like isoform X1 [Myzus persicae]XP_022180536.1 coiled-coil domain-containing protein 39-like isoform X1 [Myzus persicae]